MDVDVAATFQYRGGDGCCDFFRASLLASPFSIPEDAHVLEVGCAEFDWLTVALASWPLMTLTGIDWRGSKKVRPGVTVIAGDVMTHDFPLESFDWIVSISALEHVGLGHYNHDPKAEDGDSIALRRMHGWLKPGGVVSFDVPWNPGVAYQVVGTSHRVYDDATVQSRLHQGLGWQQVWTGIAHCKKPQTLVLTAEPQKGGEHFYYRGFQWQKT